SPVADRVAELLRYLDWRRGRQSPPHCLECGAVDPIPIPASGEFVHPGTGERVVVGDWGWADTAPWFAEFSPEGERLAPPEPALQRQGAAGAGGRRQGTAGAAPCHQVSGKAGPPKSGAWVSANRRQG